MRRKLAPRRRTRPRPRSAIQSVVDETIALHQWLAWVSDQIYGDEARGAARRWTLRRVSAGPQTVPQLARVRAVRRQTIQPVVDSLLRDGLVELLANPAHARSELVALTRRGADLVLRMDRVDERVLRAISRGVPERDLAAAAATLRAIRESFEMTSRWRAVT